MLEKNIRQWFATHVGFREDPEDQSLIKEFRLH